MAITLATIQTKIRRLTRSPSEAQITNNQINEYINTFVLYDIPEHLRLFSLHKTLTFYTSPYVDRYATNDVNVNDPLYNFKNKYTTVNPPMYVNGYYVGFTQSKDEFYSNYPKTNSVVRIGTGDGVTTNFTGTLTVTPVLQNNVTFTSIDVNNQACTLIDVPTVNPWTGIVYQLGEIIVPDDTGTVLGDINYVTGDYNITFTVAPETDFAIYSHTISYQPARPDMVLYYDNAFIMRPIPDKAYRVTIEAYMRPTEILAATPDENRELEQWWQWIAIASASKILYDRLDIESVNLLAPLLKEQELLVLRRTIVQQSNERTATIYSGQTGFEGGFNRSGSYY